MARNKHFDFKKICSNEFRSGLEGKIATHHMILYHLLEKKEKPLVLEFGVQHGRTTCILLEACRRTGGHLVSIDIEDCSDVAEADCWRFIQTSDQNIESILTEAPEIKNGVDLLHIDSVHESEHVRQLLIKWYPYVKPNGFITFHDIDETPFRKGQRKQDRRKEKQFSEMSRGIKDFFYANEDELFLEYHFGSTGMAVMKKISPIGTIPNPPVRIPVYQESIKESLRLLLNALKSRIIS